MRKFFFSFVLIPLVALVSLVGSVRLSNDNVMSSIYNQSTYAYDLDVDVIELADLFDKSWTGSWIDRNGNMIDIDNLSFSFSASFDSPTDALSNFRIVLDNNGNKENLYFEVIPIGSTNYLLTFDNFTEIGRGFLSLFDRDSDVFTEMGFSFSNNVNVNSVSGIMQFDIYAPPNSVIESFLLETRFHGNNYLTGNFSVNLGLYRPNLSVPDDWYEYASMFMGVVDVPTISTIYNVALVDSDDASILSDISRVDFQFNYDGESGLIVPLNSFFMDFYEFNVFSNNIIYQPIFPDDIGYESCSWFDIFCGLRNAITWLFFDFPLFAPFGDVYLAIADLFNSFVVFIGESLFIFNFLGDDVGNYIVSVSIFVLIFGLISKFF